MKIASIVEETTVDGTGLRTSIYTQGCSIKCKGCHNAHLQDPTGGTSTSVQAILDKVCSDSYIDGISILGGEPFDQLEDLLALVTGYKQLNPSKNIWVFTGYTYEHLQSIPLALSVLQSIDTLVDGPFIEALKDPSLAFRGSSNQRVIHLVNGKPKNL